MSLTKRTYSLPSSTIASFEHVVPAGQRSALVAALLRDWIDRQRRVKLRKDIEEGCAAMTEIYLEIEEEYHPLEEEVHRVLEEPSPARRRRARPPRSGRRVGTGR